jgi:hypothetical protein
MKLSNLRSTIFENENKHFDLNLMRQLMTKHNGTFIPDPNNYDYWYQVKFPDEESALSFQTDCRANSHRCSITYKTEESYFNTIEGKWKTRPVDYYIASAQILPPGHEDPELTIARERKAALAVPRRPNKAYINIIDPTQTLGAVISDRSNEDWMVSYECWMNGRFGYVNTIEPEGFENNKKIKKDDVPAYVLSLIKALTDIGYSVDIKDNSDRPRTIVTNIRNVRQIPNIKGLLSL